MSEKFALIAAEQANPEQLLSVRGMCAALEVSRSGFYDWVTATPSARATRRAKVAEHVKAAFAAGRGVYGVRRVHALLARSDDPEVARVGEDLVRDIMAEHGLRACQPRAYRVTTVHDEDDEPAPDRVNRDFTAPAPGCKFVGDITYLRTGQGWLYLATVIDCYSKVVVGWSMAEHMRTDLICDALEMAATHTTIAPKAVFHSDRGTQYSSRQFAALLKQHNMVASMGRTGVCWDNAMAESFFAALKNELIYRILLPTREKARRAIAEYIEVFYNRSRLHSALGYRTPAEVHHQYHQKDSIAA